MNVINVIIAHRPVNLVIHDDGHSGPAYEVVAVRNRSFLVPFARFRSLADADAYRRKYVAFYPHVRFFIRKTFM